MKLENLIKNLDVRIIGMPDADITSIRSNSNEIVKGSLFIAVKGSSFDGNQFISQAIKAGASAVFTENAPEEKYNVPVIVSSDFRKDLSLIAKRFFNDPSSSFRLIGVTGTNGKTTTTYIIKSIFDRIGKTGLLGTIKNMIGDEILNTENTTPDTVTLNSLFSEMTNSNVKNVIMEVSSHGLELDRVANISFDCAIFTNLTQDHLDFHNNMENYRNAKLKLFKMLKTNGFSIINNDDKSAHYFIETAKPNPVNTIGIRNKDSDWTIEIKEISMNGSRFTIDNKKENLSFNIESPLIGDYNIYNTVCAFVAAYRLSVPIKEILEGIKNVPPVDGRFQKFNDKSGFHVVVDYAHSPDALERLIKTVKRLTQNKVITLFGCGGDRDKKKRSIMGKIATHLSDYVIVTSDNPRMEKPENIIEDIKSGIKDRNYTVEINRSIAIKKAIKMAKSGDTVIIAGKGHENYQILGKKKYHFDDREEVKKHISEI